MKHITIYTDGACRGNPGPGGWGALMRYRHHEKLISGGEGDTTNNRMELMAAIKALSLLQEPCQVDVYTDSQYVQKGITQWLDNWEKNQWKTTGKKAVKNVDLWKTLQPLTHMHHITWHWVKGHSGHPENDLVDALANQAIDLLLTKQK